MVRFIQCSIFSPLTIPYFVHALFPPSENEQPFPSTPAGEPPWTRRGFQWITHSGVTEALNFAQVHMQQFHGGFMPQIKQLMGRLLYSHRALGDTPYGHLDEQALLEEVATDFTKATCRILGQVRLLVCLALCSTAVASLIL